MATGHEARSESIAGLRERIAVRLIPLRNRLAGDGEQRERLDALASLIDQKLNQLENLGPTIGVDRSADEMALMQDIRRLLHELERHEIASFRARADIARANAAHYQKVGAVLVVLALILAGLAAFFLHRRVRELESFITVCAWTKRVRYEDRWVPFEEFLQKRYGLQLSHGISDEAANAELERARDFAGPTDPATETSGDKG